MKLLAQCLRSRESHLYSCINDLQGSLISILPAVCILSWALPFLRVRHFEDLPSWRDQQYHLCDESLAKES